MVVGPIHPPTHPPTSSDRYTYVVKHGLAEGDKDTQAIGAFTFFVLYGLKVLKRDYFPPTPARKKSKLYTVSRKPLLQPKRPFLLLFYPPTHLPSPQVFSYLVTFSTIIVVVATSCWARVLHEAGKEIPVVGEITAGWNPTHLPALGHYPATDAFVQAIPLCLIGFMEAFSMARKYALQFKYEIDINQEAVALGIANLVSCPFSIFPVTGNFGRTALAADVVRTCRLPPPPSTHPPTHPPTYFPPQGVRTPMANVVVGLVITVILTELTEILFYIPKATLGAVISTAMLTLIDWPEMIKVRRIESSPSSIFSPVPTHPLASFIVFHPPTHRPVSTLGAVVQPRVLRYHDLHLPRHCRDGRGHGAGLWARPQHPGPPLPAQLRRAQGHGATPWPPHFPASPCVPRCGGTTW